MMKPKEDRKAKVKVAFLFLSLITAGLYFWARFVETKGFIVKEYALSSNKIPPLMDGMKIVQLSDIHYGSTTYIKELQAIVKATNDLKPTIVVFTGDLVEEGVILKDSEIDQITKVLKKITAPFKYAVSGNHDTKASHSQQILKDSSFTILNSEMALVYYLDNQPLAIYGFPSAIKNKVKYDILKEKNPYYKIVLMHEPDPIDKLANYNVDLVLAGHSHNGQVRLPFIGATYTPPLARNYYKEHYVVNGTQLYISSGLGTSLAKLRFLNKPSFNLYRLNVTK